MAQRGRAPIAAMSERETASALWPRRLAVRAVVTEVDVLNQQVGADNDVRARRRT